MSKNDKLFLIKILSECDHCKHLGVHKDAGIIYAKDKKDALNKAADKLTDDFPQTFAVEEINFI